jgi:diguanylate cyclase (GGDEF)-like protein
MLVEEMNSQNELLQERNRELLIMQDELYQANKKLEHMAITDGLTGCYNRRYLLQQLEGEVVNNFKYGIPFSIFLFDLDYFKSINDRYGHIIGDEVLCSTVEAVRSALRLTDVLARFGGEEFTVYLPHTNREQADMIADRVKEAVEQNLVSTGVNGVPVNVTISMGVISIEQIEQAALEQPKAFLRELMAQADAALYEAKYNGRNRIVKRKLA